MKQEVKQGQTDYTSFILVRDTSGNAKTGLAFGDIDLAYARVETDNDVTTTDVAPADLVTPALTDPHLDWGFLEVSATDHPGLYRLDYADAVFASGAWSAVVTLTGAGLEPSHCEFVLVPQLPYDGVNVNAMSANVVTAAAIAAAAIDNATFAADVGSTAHGTNIIALACRKILEELNLDHLLKVDTTVAADGDLEDYCVGGTVIAHLLATSADATDFKASTDSLEAIRNRGDSAWVTATGFALASVVGALADAAAAGEVTEADTLMQYLKQLINILIGAAGIATFPAEAAPANAVSLAEVIRAIHTDTSNTLDALIKDVPTVAEFEARSIVAADYVVVGDTLARVTLVDTVTTNNDLVTAAAIKTAMEADGGDLSSLMEALVNKLLITEASGNAEIFNDAGVSQGTVAAAFTSVAGVTQRKRMVI